MGVCLYLCACLEYMSSCSSSGWVCWALRHFPFFLFFRLLSFFMLFSFFFWIDSYLSPPLYGYIDLYLYISSPYLLACTPSIRTHFSISMYVCIYGCLSIYVLVGTTYVVLVYIHPLCMHGEAPSRRLLTLSIRPSVSKKNDLQTDLMQIHYKREANLLLSDRDLSLYLEWFYLNLCISLWIDLSLICLFICNLFLSLSIHLSSMSVCVSVS